MSKEGNKCFICGSEIREANKTDEHIILNAIGGHLHSYDVLCKDCNSKMGDSADAALAENLSYITDMLQIQRNRKSNHNQVMTDDNGHEVIVKSAGKELYLRRPYKSIQTDGNATTVSLTVRNLNELNGFLKGLIKDGTITESQADEIRQKAEVSEHRPVLSKRMSISERAFPSIIKSAVDFWVDRTHDIDRIQPLVPYILGQKDCKDVLYLHLFKELPYPTDVKQATHMIHVEGSKETGLLYALMEYYSMFTYIVVLDGNYQDADINMTYTFDAVSSKEVERLFSLPLTLKQLDDFRNMPHDEYVTYLPFMEQRMDSVMNIWQTRTDKEELHDVIDKVFSSYPEGCIIDKKMINEVQHEVVSFFERKFQRADKLKNHRRRKRD